MEKIDAIKECEDAIEIIFKLIADNEHKLPHPSATGYALLVLGAGMLRLNGISEEAVMAQALIGYRNPVLGQEDNVFDPDYKPTKPPS